MVERGTAWVADGREGHSMGSNVVERGTAWVADGREGHSMGSRW